MVLCTIKCESSPYLKMCPLLMTCVRLRPVLEEVTLTLMYLAMCEGVFWLVAGASLAIDSGLFSNFRRNKYVLLDYEVAAAGCWWGLSGHYWIVGQGQATTW
jgi:hypothetical protein